MRFSLVRWVGVISMVVAGASACSSDDEKPGSGGSAGASGKGGSGGKGGSSGTSGDAGAGDEGGAGGTSGKGGSAGSAGDAGAGDEGGTGGMAPTETGTVRGRVFSAATLEPLEDVSIRITAGDAVESSDDGSFSIEETAGERRVLAISLDGYATGFEPVTVLSEGESYVEIFLLPHTVSATVDSALGGTVGSPGGATADVPPDAFVDTSGGTVSGDVQVSLTVLDPSSVKEMLAFPGDFSAKNADGDSGILETYVPMDISARKDGEELTIAEGKTVTVTFPIFDPNGAPTDIELWSLDEATGGWVPEGKATKVLRGGTPVYETKLGHLSWWNCDAFADDITCIRGCVTFEGEPVRGAYIRARGISFANVGASWTDSSGCFAEDTKAGGQLEVSATALQGASLPRVITASSTRMRAADDASRCQDIGELELIAPDPANAVCPGGYGFCDSACVDVMSDLENCGSCGATCSGGGELGGVEGASCVEGVCGCADNQEICDNRCVNQQTDRQHCGGCNSPCPDGEYCSGGTCSAIVCGSDLTLCVNDCADLDTDTTHCGACSNPCEGEGLSCSQGVCGCSGGLTVCALETDGEGTRLMCADLDTDSQHCGTCETACPVGEDCQQGSCEPIQCAQTETLCGSTCADLDSDANHCGGCDQGCYQSEGQQEGGGAPVCAGGGCGCATGYSDCYAGTNALEVDCRDLSADEGSCGACGYHCTPGQTCNAGTCVAIACSGGETLCGSQCTETDTDPNNCGACGRQCPTGIGCIAGVCDCPSGDTACRSPEQSEVPPLVCVASTASCAAPPATTCGNVAGEWSLDLCGSGGNILFEQVDCAFGGGGVVGEFSSANTVNLVYYGTPCTGTLSGDTISGTCDIGGSCSFSGTRPVCAAGEVLCGGQCADTQTESYNCGFCGNNCGGYSVCQGGVCIAAGHDPGDSCFPSLPYCDAGMSCNISTLLCETCGAAGQPPCLQDVCGEAGEDCCTGVTNACIGGAVCDVGTCLPG